MRYFFTFLINTFPFLNIFSDIGDWFSDTIDDIGDFFGGIGDGISDAVDGAGDFFETIGEFFTETIPEFFTSLPDKILNAIIDAIKFVVGYIFYLITKVVCWLVELLYNFFKVFAGLSKVSYKGKGTYLINVFFDNSVINKAYWGIAIIAFVLIFVFAIAAVIRKFFDINGKEKDNYGQIIINSGKAFLIILLMTLIMSVSLTATNLLLQTVSRVFRIAATEDSGQIRYFTTEEYAHMNHAMEVIGNSSLNPSYTSRYNINSCFNRIRPDLVYLQSQGVFNYDYSDQAPCWQYTLQQIAKSARLSSDLKMDVYYDSVTLTITNAMNAIKNVSNYRPVKSVAGAYGLNSEPNLAVVLFLTGTSTAAKNSDYNAHPGVTDAVRGPYYMGTRSIYSYSNVSSDFEISIGGISYTIIIILALLTGWQLLQCILACAVRIFNLMLLYIVAPTFAATYPLDGGQRFKNWTQAFVIQCLNVFGTVITMRLLIIYIPIVMSGDLVIFSDGFLDLVAKAVLIFAGTVAAARAPQLFSGLLTGNGAQASVGAGDMSSWANRGTSFAGGVVGGVVGTTGLANAMSDFANRGGLPGTLYRQFHKGQSGGGPSGGGQPGVSMGPQQGGPQGGGQEIAGAHVNSDGSMEVSPEAVKKYQADTIMGGDQGMHTAQKQEAAAPKQTPGSNLAGSTQPAAKDTSTKQVPSAALDSIKKEDNSK